MKEGQTQEPVGGMDENNIHANDTFFYLPTMTTYVCVGRDEGKVWYVPYGEMESKWFDKSDCQLIVAPSGHHLSNRISTSAPWFNELYQSLIHMYAQYSAFNVTLGEKTTLSEALRVIEKFKWGYATPPPAPIKTEGEDFESIAKTIILSIDHYRQSGRDDIFNIRTIADYLERCFSAPPAPVGIDVEELAADYLKKVGTHDRPDITKHDFIEGFKVGYSAQCDVCQQSGILVEELWDEFSEHIDDDIFSLEQVAGSSVIKKTEFIKLIEKIKAGYSTYLPQSSTEEEKATRNRDTKYTYYHVDFNNCSAFDGDYMICESLDEVMDLLQLVDINLDDPESEALVEIKGVGMTPAEYDEWFKENN